LIVITEGVEHVRSDELESNEAVGEKEDKDNGTPDFLEDVANQHTWHCKNPQEQERPSHLNQGER
jgi:hypothetical protein